MTIEEAIQRTEKKSAAMVIRAEALDDMPGIYRDTEKIRKCRIAAEEYKQLADWLKDYKKLLEQNKEE